ncbi:MAG: iron ABC transporter permease, partial [Acidobacteria bacterium]|nr:iron ABC transporter permease [Acidobacteriota bacterium]
VLTLYFKPLESTSINYFLSGFISPLSTNEIIFSVSLFLLTAILLYLLGDEIDILSFSDDESRTIGVDVKKIRTLSILFASILASLVVSIAGMIGFIGLIVPHIAKNFTENEFKKLFFASIVLGSSITLLSYSLAKFAELKVVVPAGLYINLFGIVFFVYLFVRKGFSNGS